MPSPARTKAFFFMFPHDILGGGGVSPNMIQAKMFTPQGFSIKIQSYPHPTKVLKVLKYMLFSKYLNK